MRAIVFSDIHVHPWPGFSRLEDGVNDRLLDTLLALDFVAGIAATEAADCILFGGDFFHTQKLDATTLSMASRTLEQFAGLRIPFLGVEGNHDQQNRLRQFTSTSGLRVPKNFKWLRRESIEVGGVTIWGSPYGDHQPPEDTPDVAIQHRGILGAQVSDYFISPFDDDLRLEDAPTWAKRLLICGHFHKPQAFVAGMSMEDPKADSSFVQSQKEQPMTLVPGAPLQHTWGDAGQDRGVWIVDVLDDKTIAKFHPLKGLPKFLKITEKNLVDLNYAEGNFVSVEFETDLPQVDIDELVKELAPLARGYSVQAGKPDVTRPEGDRIEVGGSDDLEKSVRAYADKFGGDDAKELAELGVEILKSAR